jgi:hypothetical protein
MMEHSGTTGTPPRESAIPAGEQTTVDQPERASGGSADSRPGGAR